MRVLVVGGYGFIGSHIAERYKKEGNHIIVLDNLSSGQKNNLKTRHRFFQMDASDVECEKIFISQNIDIVIYCVRGTVSNDKMKLSGINSSIGAFSNILLLSAKHRVPKFVNISSTEIYGELNASAVEETSPLHPKSTLGIYAHLCENLCKSIEGSTDMRIISLRTATVYGPRQSIGDDKESLLSLLENYLHGEDIKQKNNWVDKDLIYISDLAYAAFKAGGNVESGSYNITSGHSTSIDDLIMCFGFVANDSYSDIEESSTNNGYSISNRKAIASLDWVPIVSLLKGINYTYKGFVSSTKKERYIISKNRTGFLKEKGRIRLFIPYIENFAFFILIAIANTYFAQNSVVLPVDLGLLYILIFGIFFGFKQSLISASLCSILFLYSRIQDGMYFGSIVYDTGVVLSVVLYFLIAGIVGHIIDKKDHLIKAGDDQISKQQSDVTYITSVLDETLTVKDELEKRLIDYDDSFAKIYSAISALNNLEPDKVIYNAIPIINQFMHTESCTVYMKAQRDYFRCFVSYGTTILPKSVRMSDYPLFGKITQTGNLFVNRDLKADLPMFAAPIVDNGSIIAIITVDKIGFNQLNLYYENLFILLSRMITDALLKAYKHYDRTADERFIAGTRVLKEDEFNEQINIRKEAREKTACPFLLLRINNANTDERIRAASIKISHILRDTDIIGQVGNNLVVILSNTSTKEAETAIKRLSDGGISAEISEE